ncbi:MAG: nucleotidyl transferase AbiEii/AbiGii toxin family protein, partial [Chloroflexota bacterium]|nr:nucleotidyl transferase AbiEii/AbiGii toxin family protein [Anaerolineales bacterium]
MKFHTESLSKKQFLVLQKLAPIVQPKGFYLGGGTALALYLGHRVSVDLDWFTSGHITDALVLAQSLHTEKLDFVTEQTAPGTLHGSISNVRVTFLEYQYPLLKAFSYWNEVGCSLASLEDLACMKLSAAAQRGARKDFCDIYALGTKKFSLEEMLSFYRTKFGIQDVGHVLYGLAYFD